MDTTHYAPLFMVLLVSALITTMVGWKVGSIISNPALFIDSSVENAARDVAIVCDGKVDSKQITPPPPGASYRIMNCLDYSTTAATSNIVMAAEFGAMAYQLSGFAKDARELAQGMEKYGDDFRDILKNIVKRMPDGDLQIDADDLDDVMDTIREARERLDDLNDALDNMDDAVDNFDDAKDAYDRSRQQIEESKEQLDLLEEELSEADGGLTLDCAEKEEVCDSLFAQSRIDDVEDNVEDLYTTTRKTLNDAEKLGDVEQSVRNAGRKSLKELVDFREEKRLLTRTMANLPNTMNLFFGADSLRRVTGRVRRRYINHWVYDFFTRRELSVTLDYLDDNPQFYDVLSGGFVGVRYTPTMIGMVTVSEEEGENEALLDLSERAFNVSGAFENVARRFKRDMPAELRNKGYYDTAGEIYNTGTSTLITFSGKTNIRPDIFAEAVQEYVGQIGNDCTSQACVSYAGELMETAANFMVEDATLEDLKDAAGSYSDGEIAGEQEDFLEVLDYLEEKDAEADYAKEASVALQGEVAGWLREHCETDTLQFSGRAVEVAPCGMVLDCSPGNFCYVGLPVVEADPWMPYVPVTYLDEKESGSLAELAGMNYDSRSRVVTPGVWTGCGGLLGGEFAQNKVLICATLPGVEKCRVVDCGKPVRTEYVPFTPGVVAEHQDGESVSDDGDDSVLIRGNFMKW